MTMIAHGDALETSNVNADSIVPDIDRIMSSNHRSFKLNAQRTLPSVLCRCLFPQSDYRPSNNKPIDDRNNQLLPSSALQSVTSDVLCMDDETKDEYSRPSVRLPSSAILTDAILSQAKEIDSSSCKNAARFSIRTFRRFKFSRKKSIVREEICKHYIEDSIPDSFIDESLREVDKPLVFSPPPSQIVPDSLAHGRPTTALLGPRSELDKGKKCFVIDLDETLVHSSFKVIDQADFKVGVEIDGITHRVYVLKRPHVDTFLATMANLYECVLFTASLAKYADPVADFIDKWSTFRHRLFRESCVYHRGNYVKDISNLGRPINQVVILDNSPASYMFHAHHAVQISSWFDDVNDRALLDLIPYFERLASHPNVVEFLRTNHPPTSAAAVGSVGLPLGVLGAPGIAQAESPGRSAADPVSQVNSIISSVRRSPAPPPTTTSTTTTTTPLAAGSTLSPPITTSLSDPRSLLVRRDIVHPVQSADSRRTAYSVLQRHHAAHLASVNAAQRLLGPSAIPVLSPVTSPGHMHSPVSLLTATGSHRPPSTTSGSAGANTLPTAVSLATYVPITTYMNTPVTISKPASGNAAKLTVPSNNSGVAQPAVLPMTNSTLPGSLSARLPLDGVSPAEKSSSAVQQVDVAEEAKVTNPDVVGRSAAKDQSNDKVTSHTGSSRRVVRKGFFRGFSHGTHSAGDRTSKQKGSGNR